MDNTRMATRQGLAIESIAEQDPCPSPPDSEGGIPLDVDAINDTPVYQNSLLSFRAAAPQLVLPSDEPEPDNVPRNGALLKLDFDVEHSGGEEDGLLPNLSRKPSPSDSGPNYTLASTIPDLRLESWNGKLELSNGEDPIREQVLQEEDVELIDGQLRPPNVAYDGEVSAKIHRAARTGHSLPKDSSLRQSQRVHYPPSEKSNVSDGGFRKATEEGNRVTKEWSEQELRKPIQDRLLEALQKIPGHSEKKGFFAQQQLKDLIDERCVTRELQLCFMGILDAKTIEKTAQQICGTDNPPGQVDPGGTVLFQKIFTILVLSEKTASIRLFLEENVADHDLPLSKVPCGKASSSIFGLARRGDPGVPLACFREWTTLAIIRFEEWQWTTLAPFFFRGERKKVNNWPLQDQIPLPFTFDSRFDETSGTFEPLEFEGGFSNVFKVGIHSEHHTFHAPHISSEGFAIKCLISRDREEFKREADTLMKFSGDAHPHLVSLLATYEQFKRYYLIFHWAEADLLDYWNKRYPSPLVDYDNILWVAEQCSGITDGLLKIHKYESTDSKSHQSKRHGDMLDPKSATQLKSTSSQKRPPKQLYGTHGDIKPQNILWFRDPHDETDKGILKISDFGLTEFSADNSKSYKPNINVAGSPDYRPPEVDNEGGIIGRSYDIWSLGCLYLELITWLLGGCVLVEKFRRDRHSYDPLWFGTWTDTFFEIVRCEVTSNNLGAMVKPQVTSFILGLHCHPSCTEFIHAFLNLVQMDMLVVKSPNPRDKKRISCVDLNARLLTMLEKCQNDRCYASKPAPWNKNNRVIVEEAVETDFPAETAELLRHNTNVRVHTGKTQTRSTPRFPGNRPKSSRTSSLRKPSPAYLGSQKSQT